MYQANQQVYIYIVRFIQAYRAKPTASDDELCLKLGLSPSDFNALLGRWSVSLDIDQFRYFLSRHYTRQQFVFGEDVMRSPSSLGNAALLDLQTFSNTEFVHKAGHICLKYGVVDTPFGCALLGFTEQGMCHLTFHDECDEPEKLLRSRWTVGQFLQDQPAAESVAEQVFNVTDGAKKIPAWTYGTNFQLKVWQALLKLPSGCLINYQQLAAQAGSPRAARAAGSAMANNHLSWLIPCHRVLRQSGDFGEYGGGVERKMAMVAYEASRIGQKA